MSNKGLLHGSLARREHFPPKSHVARGFTFNFSLLFYNVNLSFSELEIDGDGLLGLVEKGGSSLATENYEKNQLSRAASGGRQNVSKFN